MVFREERYYQFAVADFQKTNHFVMVHITGILTMKQSLSIYLQKKFKN